MNIKTGYKQTEIGVIPEDWEVKKLSDVSQLITKGTTPKNFSESGINFIKIECFDGNLINQEKFAFVDVITHSTELKRSILHEGDILFAIAGATIGKCNIVQNAVLPANTNQALAIVRLKQNENREYVYRLLASYKMQKYITDNVSVGAQPNLNLEQIGNFSFSYPPLPEQTAIAAALSDVDALMGELDKLIAKKRDIKQATMQQLLTGKKRLAGFSGEWEVKRLGDIFEITAGGDLDKNNFSTTKDEKYCFPVYSNSLSDKGLYGYSPTYSQEENTITVTARGTVGFANARNHKYSAIGRVLVLSPLEKISCFFVAEYINNKVSFANESTGVPQLTAPQISKYDIIIPSYEEQTAIATIFSDMDAEINALQQKREKTAQLKQGMMQELLTGRIRLSIKE